MQQALCLVWTQSHHRNLAAWEERLDDSIRWSGTVQAEEWPTSTLVRPREQLRLLTGFTLPCAEPSPQGISKLQPLGHRFGEWDQQAACTWARKLLPVTGWIPVLTWMGPNRKRWIGTVWIFYSVNLALLLCRGWGMWFITYRNLDSPWLNVKTLASVRKFMNFTHMIIDNFY